MEEIWKYIPGFDNAYQVSNLGRVKSMNYNHTGKEKLRKLDLKKTGYQQVELFKNRKPKVCLVHRLVAITFIPNPENKKEVNHINGIKDDNRVENLEWVTPSENVRHSYNTGFKKGKFGAENPMFNKQHTKEAKEKISKANKGRKLSLENRKHISEAKKGSKHPAARKFVCINTGEIFTSASEIKPEYNVCGSSVYKCCRGKQKTTGKLPDGTPLKWMYYDDYLKQIEKEE